MDDDRLREVRLYGFFNAAGVGSHRTIEDDRQAGAAGIVTSRIAAADAAVAGSAAAGFVAADSARPALRFEAAMTVLAFANCLGAAASAGREPAYEDADCQDSHMLSNLPRPTRS